MRMLANFAFTLMASLAALPIGSVMAEEVRSESTASLKGTFRFTSVKTCTDNAIGATFHFYFTGTITYDGHGAAQLTQQGTVVHAGTTPTSFEETAELTYIVKPNGSISQEGTFRAVDQSYTLTGSRMIGQIDAQGSVLIFNAVAPPEKETVRVPGGGLSEYYCGYSGTAVRIR